MAKRTKSSEFEKGEITALKRVRKSQRKISKALGWSKTIICNYLKSPNKYGTRKLTGRPGKSPQFKRRIVRAVKKKTLSTSKILKSLVDAPCSTRTIRRHLNNKKKLSIRKELTMVNYKKHKEKQLEYAHQYQTMRMAKSCFLGQKEIQFRWSRWLSEVMACKKFSRRELLNKAQWRRISYDLGALLIFRKTTVCQWSTKSSWLQEDTKWFISCTRRVSSMWRRMDFSAR